MQNNTAEEGISTAEEGTLVELHTKIKVLPAQQQREYSAHSPGLSDTPVVTKIDSMRGGSGWGDDWLGDIYDRRLAGLPIPTLYMSSL